MANSGKRVGRQSSISFHRRELLSHRFFTTTSTPVPSSVSGRLRTDGGYATFNAKQNQVKTVRRTGDMKKLITVVLPLCGDPPSHWCSNGNLTTVSIERKGRGPYRRPSETQTQQRPPTRRGSREEAKGEAEP